MRGTPSTAASDLARFMVRRGVSIDEAARRWGLTRSTLRHILAGDRKLPAHVQQEVTRGKSDSDQGSSGDDR